MIGATEVPVGVRRISRAEYLSHKLARGPVMAPAMEKVWFADEKGRIGAVFMDMFGKDWNFVVLAPDSEGCGDGWPVTVAWTRKRRRSRR